MDSLRSFFHYSHHQPRLPRNTAIHFSDLHVPLAPVVNSYPTAPTFDADSPPLALDCSLDSVNVPIASIIDNKTAGASQVDTSSATNNAVTLYRLFASVIAPAMAPKKVPLDFILCLDVSGSMDMPGKMNVIKSAICTILLPQLTMQDRIGVVVFSDNAEILLHLTQVNQNNIEQIRNRILSIKTFQQTNFLAGLSSVCTLCTEFGANRGAQRVVLFFSDGWDSFIDDDVTKKQREDRISQFVTLVDKTRETYGVELHAYGLCSAIADHGVDADVLRRMSERGNGEFNILTTNNMEEKLKTFFNRLTTCVAQRVTITFEAEPEIFRLVNLFPPNVRGGNKVCIGNIPEGQRRDVGALLQFISPHGHPLSTVTVIATWIDAQGNTKHIQNTVKIAQVQYPLSLAAEVHTARCNAILVMVNMATNLRPAIDSRNLNRVNETLKLVDGALTNEVEKMRAISHTPAGKAICDLVDRGARAQVRTAINSRPLDTLNESERAYGTLMSIADDLFHQRNFQEEYQSLPARTDHEGFAKREAMRQIMEISAARKNKANSTNEKIRERVHLLKLCRGREDEYIASLSRAKRSVMDCLTALKNSNSLPKGMSTMTLRTLMIEPRSLLADINSVRKRLNQPLYKPPKGLGITELEQAIEIVGKKEKELRRMNGRPRKDSQKGDEIPSLTPSDTLDLSEYNRRKREMFLSASNLCENLDSLIDASKTQLSTQQREALNSKVNETTNQIRDIATNTAELEAKHPRQRSTVNDDILADLENLGCDDVIDRASELKSVLRSHTDIGTDIGTDLSTETFDAAREAECRRLFSILDSDKDGLLTVRELGYALEALELNTAAERVRSALPQSGPHTAEQKLEMIIRNGHTDAAKKNEEDDVGRVPLKTLINIATAQSSLTIEECFYALSKGKRIIGDDDLSNSKLPQEIIEFVKQTFPKVKTTNGEGYDFIAWLNGKTSRVFTNNEQTKRIQTTKTQPNISLAQQTQKSEEEAPPLPPRAYLEKKTPQKLIKTQQADSAFDRMMEERLRRLKQE